MTSRLAGRKLLAVASGKVITCTHVTVVPITDPIIVKVEAMAAKQGIQSLKLESRSYDDAATTDLEGVEEDNDEDDDPDYNDAELDKRQNQSRSFGQS
jgi:hypothetical protein